MRYTKEELIGRYYTLGVDIYKLQDHESPDMLSLLLIGQNGKELSTSRPQGALSLEKLEFDVNYGSDGPRTLLPGNPFKKEEVEYEIY